MAGAFDAVEPGVRVEFGGGAHRGRGDESIAAAGQPQAGLGERGELRAQVEAAEHGQALQQRRLGGLAASEHAVTQLLQRLAAVLAADGFKRHEALQGAPVIAAQLIGELLEDLGRHGLRPVRPADEARRGGDGNQAAHLRGSFGGGLQGQQTAERPAQPRRCWGGLEDPRDCAGEVDSVAALGAVAVARQVDQVQLVVLGQALDQRREHAAVHGPAVQQDERGAVALDLDVHCLERGIGGWGLRIGD